MVNPSYSMIDDKILEIFERTTTEETVAKLINNRRTIVEKVLKDYKLLPIKHVRKYGKLWRNLQVRNWLEN